MLSPSRCCAKGIHVVTTINESYTRCVWCGLVARIGASNSDASTSPLPTTATAPESCCGPTVSRQANYPRPTITERYDNAAVELDERFRTMARAHAANSDSLQQWIHSGNKLPSVYR